MNNYLYIYQKFQIDEHQNIFEIWKEKEKKYLCLEHVKPGVKLIQEVFSPYPLKDLCLFTSNCSEEEVILLKSLDFQNIKINLSGGFKLSGNFEKLFQEKKNLKSFSIFSDSRHKIEPILKELSLVKCLKKLKFLNIGISDDFYEVLTVNKDLKMYELENLPNLDLDKIIKSLNGKEKLETLILKVYLKIDETSTTDLRDFIVKSNIKNHLIQHFTH